MKLSTITGWASGLNYWKWGAILVALLAWTAIVGTVATSRAKVECERQKTELAEKRTDSIIDFTNVQARATTVAGKRAAEIAAEVAVADKALDELYRTKQDLQSCRLSNAEVAEFNRLAKQSRRR